MKSDDKLAWSEGLLGLLLAGVGAACLGVWKPGEADLAPARRLGYSRPAATLAEQDQVSGASLSWLASFQHALRIQLSTTDLLRIVLPREEDLVLLETDVQPAAWFHLEASYVSNWELRVKPWQGEPWKASSSSGGAVRPAAYPANGRLAYYDLGRIWITDLQGMRLQSLKHVPLLEKGGDLYWDYSGTRLSWMGTFSPEMAAVELGVLPSSRKKENRARP